MHITLTNNYNSKQKQKTWTKLQNDNIIPPPSIKYFIQHEFQYYLLQSFMHAQCTIQTKLKSSLFLKNYCNTTLHTFRQIDNTKQKMLHEKIMGVMLYIMVQKYASPKKS